MELEEERYHECNCRYRYKIINSQREAGRNEFLRSAGEITRLLI